MQPFTLLSPAKILTPLVVDSPHSGREYPADFNYACPLQSLRQTEDFLVDELTASAAEAGATFIAARFPRCYIDVNRAEDDIDPALLASPWPTPLAPAPRTLHGAGLVPRLCQAGVPVYNSPLPIAEVQKRIAQFYRPYHEALQNALARCMRTFGTYYLINCHSMPHKSGTDGVSARADFVLGDRNGTSCDPSFTRRAHQWLLDCGYSVALNNPYKGAEIVQRYGRPHAGQQALQLEINRRLYMNESTLEKNSGFAQLQRDLGAFFRALAAEVMSDAPDRLAAE